MGCLERQCGWCDFFHVPFLFLFSSMSGVQHVSKACFFLYLCIRHHRFMMCFEINSPTSTATIRGTRCLSEELKDVEGSFSDSDLGRQYNSVLQSWTLSESPNNRCWDSGCTAFAVTWHSDIVLVFSIAGIFLCVLGSRHVTVTDFTQFVEWRTRRCGGVREPCKSARPFWETNPGWPCLTATNRTVQTKCSSRLVGWAHFAMLRFHQKVRIFFKRQQSAGAWSLSLSLPLSSHVHVHMTVIWMALHGPALRLFSASLCAQGRHSIRGALVTAAPSWCQCLVICFCLTW